MIGTRRARRASFRPHFEWLEDRRVPAAFVRLDQVGYAPAEPKRALLMASSAEDGATFQVLDDVANPVLTAPLGAALNPWSPAFPNVYVLDLSSVTAAGTYTIVVTGSENATSPPFRIDTPANLYTGFLADAAFFFQAQRDGRDVNPAVLGRQPSHLADETATIYKTPLFKKSGALAGKKLTPIGGPIDVAGGWHDAGDYSKFVVTTSYTVVTLLLAVREHPGLLVGGAADFAAEAKVGLDWLLKMWDDATGTLYVEVGIATGNGTTIRGDHDAGWRLPEADDQLNVAPGDPLFFVKNRPVFLANKPGKPISPNLAGRMAAAFALGFQVYQATDPDYAARCLRAAEHIFDLAKIKNVGKLLAAVPAGVYQEREWQDDMELGAAELHNALLLGNLPAGLPHTDPSFYLQASAQWARAYLRSKLSTFDMLNFADVSQLAHYELHKAMTRAGNPTGLAVTQAELIGNLDAVLQQATFVAQQDPFGLGFEAGFEGDTSARTVGVAVAADMFGELTGTQTYAELARAQLAWIFGRNAWGSSFLVGAGTVFPQCVHHQVANLVGSLDGQGPILRGALVEGAVNDANVGALQAIEGARPCPNDGMDPFAIFNGRGARYIDTVSAFATVEPALDFSALNPLLFARLIDAPPPAAEVIRFADATTKSAPPAIRWEFTSIVHWLARRRSLIDGGGSYEFFARTPPESEDSGI